MFSQTIKPKGTKFDVIGFVAKSRQTFWFHIMFCFHEIQNIKESSSMFSSLSPSFTKLWYLVVMLCVHKLQNLEELGSTSSNSLLKIFTKFVLFHCHFVFPRATKPKGGGFILEFIAPLPIPKITKTWKTKFIPFFITFFWFLFGHSHVMFSKAYFFDFVISSICVQVRSIFH
jgi:hypothetical protein